MAGTVFTFQSGAAELPPNIGGNLRRLIAINANSPATKLNASHLALNSKTNQYDVVAGKPNFFVDEQNRTLVRVVLDGSISPDQAAEAIQKLGGRVVAKSAFARGLVSAYIPLDKASELAGQAGVKSLHLTLRPIHNVGAVTAQSVAVLDVTQVLSKGITGKGVTVAVLSDSFNTSGNPDNALADVKSGDLPNTKAIAGGEGLKALIEDSPNGTDEGRAMLQVVHDMAPGAALCFATADGGELNFAGNILKLAADEDVCNADVIVDDTYYFAEPFFSDGVVADAVNQVSTYRRDNGSRVTYLSSAGNEQYSGYDATFQPVSLATGKASPNTAVDLSTIPSSINIKGGLHNFGTAGNVIVAQPLYVSGNPVMILQWNDPFDVGKITSTYDLLLFDANGKFIKASDTADNASSDDNAFLTDEPIQGIAFDTSATQGFAEYYLVIAESSEGTHEAKRIRWVAAGDGSVAAAFQTEDTPVVFGHVGAVHDIAVAAYDVNPPPFTPTPTAIPELEDFTSPGPFTNYFDSNGNRLSEPEVRQKPDIACTDGLFTTFFGQQILPTDTYYRFFGTSAAAPCAAGVAALVIDKAIHEKTPYHPDPSQILTALRTSPKGHDEDPFFSHDTVNLPGGGAFHLQAHGNNDNLQDPSNFLVQLTQAPGWTLTGLSLTIPSRYQLEFFRTSSYPFELGATSPGVTVSVLNLIPPSGTTLATDVTLRLGFKAFKSGDYAEFDVDRADTVNGYIDDDADRLGNTAYHATLMDAHNHTFVIDGLLNNYFGAKWTVFDGYGLINAENAVANIP